MFKYRLDLILPLFILITNKRSLAFDPYSAAMAANTAYSFMNKADEAADVGFALTDLLEELGADTEAEDAMLQSSINRIESVYSRTRELGWLGTDISNSINTDLNQGKSLSKKIKALRNTIQSSKKIATIMGFRPKAGEKAVRIQEIKINSMMLEELQAIRRAQYLAYLENQEAKHKRDLFLKEILESGKKSKGRLQ